MRRSESITALAKALVLAKQKMEPPTKNKVNPHFKNHYADLAAVKSSYHEALGANGLGVLHALSEKDGHVLLTTTLLHESGEWIASDYPISAGKPQEIAMAVTYGKRCNSSALLDIAAEDDDDGNAAQEAATKAPEKVASKPAPEPVPVKASVLTREEIEAMHSLAKTKGLSTISAFREYLKGLTQQEMAKDLSRAEYVSVMDALKAMREKVPA